MANGDTAEEHHEQDEATKETGEQKRIVSKRQYVQALGKKVGFYSFSSLALIGGSIGFGLALYAFLVNVSGAGNHFFLHSAVLAPLSMVLIPVFIIIAGVSIPLMKRAKAIEPVQPVTDRNAHLLPLQDTLVRSSDIPTTVQQAELLRATQNQETPPEELLRSVAGDEYREK